MAPERIHRFTRTERAMHWTHAGSFFVMLATGLVLYIPSLSTWINRRNAVKNVHLVTAVVWVIALAAVIIFGNRKSLRRTWREVETFDHDDREWLKRRRAPQGRLNAGQKVNTLITAAFAILFALSGFLLWLGERDHRFLFDGTGTVHDLLTFASIALVAGHLYLALLHPSTRHSLRGITTGDVDLDWAMRNHAKWVAEAQRGLPPAEVERETKPVPAEDALI